MLAFTDHDFNCDYLPQLSVEKRIANTFKPVHFLANSVIGPSFYIHMPSNITYSPMDSQFGDTFNSQYDYRADPSYTDADDAGCVCNFECNYPSKAISNS